MNRPDADIKRRTQLWGGIATRGWRLAAQALLGVGLLMMFAGLAPAAEWSAPKMVGGDEQFDDTSVGVSVSSDGDAWYVWSGVDAGSLDSVIYFVCLEATGGATHGMLTPPDGGLDWVPFMSMGQDDVPWVIWERFGDGYEQAISHWDGDAWTAPETVFVQGGPYDWYTVCAIDSDDVWVAKEAYPEGRDKKSIAMRHFDGGRWGPVEWIGCGAHHDRQPRLAATESALWVGWFRERYDGDDLIMAELRDASGWHEEVIVDSMSGNGAMGDVAIAPGGSPIMAWLGCDHTPAADIYWTSLSDGHWEPRRQLNEQDDDPTWDDDQWVRFGTNGAGEVWASWVATRLGEPSSWVVASRLTDSGWSAERIVSHSDTAAEVRVCRPEIAVSSSGVAHVAWELMDDESPYDTDIYRSQYVNPGIVLGFSADVADGCVRLSWTGRDSVSNEATIVRSEVACAASTAPHFPPPPEALDINAEIHSTGASSWEVSDCAVVQGLRYLYWLVLEGGERIVGPVCVCVAGEEIVYPVIRDVFPNPSSYRVRVSVESSHRGDLVIGVYQAGGRCVASLPVSTDQRGETGSWFGMAEWDCRDSRGYDVAAGVYYFALAGESRAGAGGSVVLVR